MEAKYLGRCPHCDRYYSAGTEIEKRGNKWYPVDCPGCKIEDMQRVAIKELHEKHHIGYGLWGYMENGAAITTTRQEWADQCVKHGVLTEDQRVELMRHWGPFLSIRDLTD